MQIEPNHDEFWNMVDTWRIFSPRCEGGVSNTRRGLEIRIGVDEKIRYSRMRMISRVDSYIPRVAQGMWVESNFTLALSISTARLLKHVRRMYLYFGGKAGDNQL